MVELQTADSQITDKSQWLSLRDACRQLDVSNTTLRQWADNGFLRVYRTPGGHRRFLRSDVESFANAPEKTQDHVRDDAIEGSALIADSDIRIFPSLSAHPFERESQCCGDVRDINRQNQ